MRGWIELYEAMAQDFDRALPYRAAVFLAVCRLDQALAGGKIPTGKPGKAQWNFSGAKNGENTWVFFGIQPT